MADVKHIRTEAEYEAAMKLIDELMDAGPDTAEGSRLDALVNAVEAYESKTIAIGHPEPIAIIKFRMEQSGLCAADLIPFLGGKEAVNDLLSGRRPITLAIATALQRCLDIPVEALLPDNSAPSEDQSVSRLQ